MESDADDNVEVNTEAGAPVATVARTVLAAYFDQLSATEGFGEIAPHLRKVVLEDGQFGDAAIRAALFADGS